MNLTKRPSQTLNTLLDLQEVEKLLTKASKAYFPHLRNNVQRKGIGESPSKPINLEIMANIFNQLRKENPTQFQPIL